MECKNSIVAFSCNCGKYAFNRKSSMAAFAMGLEDRGLWYGDKVCKRGGDAFGTSKQNTFSEAVKVSFDGTF